MRSIAQLQRSAVFGILEGVAGRCTSLATRLRFRRGVAPRRAVGERNMDDADVDAVTKVNEVEVVAHGNAIAKGTEVLDFDLTAAHVGHLEPHLARRRLSGVLKGN